jgi:hypothetical protein
MKSDQFRMLDFRKTLNLIAFRCNTKGAHSPDFCPIILEDEWEAWANFEEQLVEVPKVISKWRFSLFGAVHISFLATLGAGVCWTEWYWR